MAIGGDTLGLLFNVDIDASAATQVINQLRNQSQALVGQLVNQFKALNLETGVTAEQTQALLETMTKLGLTEEQQISLLKGFVDAYQKAKKEVQDTNSALDDGGKKIDAHGKALKEHQTTVSQSVRNLQQLNNIFNDIAHANFGDALAGIAKALLTGNPLVIALVGAAIALGVAILAAKKAIDEFADAVQKVGTDSRDDFKQLQADLAGVGEQLTLADHALAQGILKSFKDLSSSVTAFFVNVMRPAGPALITLLQDLTKLIQGMIPFAEKLGVVLREAFISIIAPLRTLQLLKDLGVGALLLTPGDVANILTKVAEQARKEIDALGKSLQNATGTFKDEKTKQEDMVATSLEAQLKLVQENQKREEQIYEATIRDITLLYRAGAVDRVMAAEIEEFAKQKLLAATNANTQKQVDLQTQLTEHQKKRALTQDEIDARDQATANKKFEDQKRFNAAAQAADKALDDADKEEIKRQEARLDRLDKIIEKTKELDEIVRNQARQPQGVPGQIPGGEDRGLPGIPGIKTVTQAIKDLPSPDLSVWQTWAKGANDALGSVADSFGGVKGIMTEGLQHIASALSNSIQGWILYGKLSGKALKQAAAEAIAGMVAQAIVASIFELAAGLAALAWGDGPGATKHFLAAKEYGTVAVVGAIVGGAIGAAGGILGSSGASQASAGGGFGGGDTTPSPVNISLGGTASTLGITMASAQIDAINKLNDKITSMSPGDVVTRAADTHPDAFAAGTLEAGRRNGAYTRELMQLGGARV
jgi:hypothetical protein